MTTHVSQPPAPATLYLTPAGKMFRQAGRNEAGEQLFVLDGVDPEACPRWARATEADLVEPGQRLTPVLDGSAEATR
ncbi:hypothetical protein ACFUJR_27910 [Streptomyces sp. NPDC057271]|uniref:hypothetical protein n=1 Tax=unclassified Streptomyces TaxID=2593676 RepID=UPI00363FE821